MGGYPRLEKDIAGFQHQEVRRMSGMVPKRQLNWIWVYQPIGAALAAVVPEEIRIYIACRQNTVAQYIATRPIMDLYLEAERRPGMRLSWRWWKQPALYILGIIGAHAAA